MLTMCSPLWIQLYFPSSCDLRRNSCGEHNHHTFIDFILPSNFNNNPLSFLLARENIVVFEYTGGEKKGNFGQVASNSSEIKRNETNGKTESFIHTNKIDKTRIIIVKTGR